MTIAKKYNEIIGIRKNFDDTYNIIEDKSGAWSSFITNDQFEKNLTTIIRAFSATSSNINTRKSIWIQGTYGTGKSHSTAVVKHLLSDDVEEIQDFINSLSSKQLRHEILEFRKNHKVLPIVLRGAYTIANNKDMSYEIQKQVRETLKKYDINICVNTDFDEAVKLLETPYMDSFWEILLANELKVYCRNKENIKEYLLNFDKEILNIIDGKYREIHNGGFGTTSITKWLKEVQHEIKKSGFADHMVIIWDEFTSLLSISESRSILNTIQDIAELAKEKDVTSSNPNDLEGIYLIVVTHKKLEQTDAYKLKDSEEQKLALARFATCVYDMQPNTIYHILSSTLNRKDEKELNNLIEKRVKNNPAVMHVIDRILEKIDSNAEEVKNKVISLYPFHPYTAHLSTFVSRQLGDAERSVFSFLNDSEVGFLKFIQNDINDINYMDPSYIWDFFIKINKMSTYNNRLSEIINKYNLHIDTIKKKGNEYVDVFKVTLLLNALNYLVAVNDDSDESSLVRPNERNIIDCFSGIFLESQVLEILNYFDESNIIVKTADGIYEISVSAVSPDKINKYKSEALKKFDDVTTVKETYPYLFSTLDNLLIKNNDKNVREVNLIYMSSKEKKTQMDLTLSSKRTVGAKVNIVVVISRGNMESTKNISQERPCIDVENDLRKLSEDEINKNIIFLNIRTEFGDINYNRFIDDIANSNYYASINDKGQSDANDGKARGWIKKWIDNIINDGQVFCSFRGYTDVNSIQAISNKISNEFIPTIYPYGLDKLPTLKKPQIWNNVKSTKIIENIIFNNNRDEIFSKMKGGVQNNIQSLFKDENNNNIFDSEMNLLDDASNDNPVVRIIKQVDETLVCDKKTPRLDLAEKLKFLFSEPYGLSKNPISYAVIAFAMKKYVDKLFICSSGVKIEKTKMRDTVENIVDSITNQKNYSDLLVRFSSQEEIDLIESLNKLFEIKEDGLLQAKWRARESFAEKRSAPFWALKYGTDLNKNTENTINSIFRLLISAEENINQSLIVSTLNEIKEHRIELRNALSSTENEDLLKKFIEYTLNKEIAKEQYDYIINYLKKTMEKKVEMWEEDEIKSKIHEANFEYDLQNSEYKVTFVSNCEVQICSQNVKYGECIKNEDITRKNYIFGGWYLDQELTKQYAFSKVTKDLVLFAKWIKLEEPGETWDGEENENKIEIIISKINNTSVEKLRETIIRLLNDKPEIVNFLEEQLNI